MANIQLFAPFRSQEPVAGAVNEAGGLAYARDPRAALALYASTGCLNGTFYADDESQLAHVLALCAEVDAGFVARTAIHARQRGHMKDMPALLLATLASRDATAFAQAFSRVVDSGRMLRNVVQILRSGRTGRRSLGSLPKRLVRQWLERASVRQILQAAIGQQPSLADVIRMVHPKPVDAEREALYGWVIGRPFDPAALPAVLREYEAFKHAPEGVLPDLPFQYFTSLPLQREHWQAMARGMSWQGLRMNLNTFARNGMFEDPAMVEEVAARLCDPEQIRRARVFPYQLLAARNAAMGLPQRLVEALERALEIATHQVPTLPGRVVVAVDVSGSMSSPVTGWRKGATSKVRCVDAAALLAACVLRSNPQARVLPFDTKVRDVALPVGQAVMAQADRLAALCGGGTTISAPLAQLNKERAKVDLLVLVSDNQSWCETRQRGATETMRQWEVLKQRCPAARLVCIDLQPARTSQLVEREDVMHVGGFSDAVFELLGDFAVHRDGAAHWIERIEAIELATH